MSSSRQVYQFKEFQLDVGERALLRNGVSVPLTPKAFDTLVALVRRSGHVVSKDVLLTEVWPDAIVEEATLAQNIFTVRKALGQDKENCQFIETVPKSGYRFVSEVQQLVSATPTPATQNGGHNHSGAPDANEIVDSKYLSAQSQEEDLRNEEPEVRNLPDDAHRLKFREPQHHESQLMGFFLDRGKKRKALVVALGTALLLIAVLLTFFFKKNDANNQSSLDLGRPGITRLTNSGTATHAAISHDGKYVAYVATEGTGQSLWVRQMSAINNLQIVSPSQVQFGGVVFAPNDIDLYYYVSPKGSRVSSLYKVPILGGASTKILTDIDSNITFSPDAKRIAFVRYEPGGRAGTLMLSNVEGTGEQKLASPPSGSSFVGAPAWSPDGKTIVCPMQNDQVEYRKVVLAAVDVESGNSKIIGRHQWQSIWHTAWLPDGRGLLMVAWDESVSSISNQIWQVSYPDGDFKILVNDLHNYNGLSTTSNGKSFVSIVSDRLAHLWVAPARDPGNATQITSGVGDKRGEVMGLSWTPDHKVVYGSTADDRIGVWIVDADGRNRKQLTTADSRTSLRPTVSPIGGPVVFVSRLNSSPHLWRMEIDASDPTQLTNGNNENFPDFSPDGNWIVYTSVQANGPSLWRISVNGGQPLLVTDKFAYLPAISPDGKLIAAYYREDPSSALQAAIFTFDGGAPIKTFSLPPAVLTFQGIRWAPDGRSITYIENQDGVSNIWSQPLDGNARHRLTNFTSDQIFRYAWSLDGSRIVFERGRNVTDVVLLTSLDYAAAGPGS